jgi:hypothetical protein
MTTQSGQRVFDARSDLWSNDPAYHVVAYAHSGSCDEAQCAQLNGQCDLVSNAHAHHDVAYPHSASLMEQTGDYHTRAYLDVTLRCYV